MKKHLFAAAIFFVASRADCQEYYNEALDAASNARRNSIRAGGAVQVSQLHSEAQTEIQAALVKQGDNNLKIAERLLKQGENNLKISERLLQQGDNKLTMAERIEGELKTLHKETADSKTQLLAVLESYRKETGTLLKYLRISLTGGFIAILAVLVAIYVQLRKTAKRDS